MSNAMCLKAKIRNIAEQKDIPVRIILQNYMFERMRVRLLTLEYKKSFVLKGGMLVAAIPVDDGISFESGTSPIIWEDDIYGGYRVALNARFDTLLTPMSIDVSAGDVITPCAILYQFAEIFSDEIHLRVMGVQHQNRHGEKTILRQGVFNIRPRDFYDAYI